MVKNVPTQIGLTTALVSLGWILFVVGQLVSSAAVSIPLLAIARVLP